jgi:protein-S-isoprenylcysteine O-methyltransferase Ste14
MSPSSIVMVARVFICVCWAAFFLPFMFQKKKRQEATERRAPASRIGIAIQGVAFFLIWFFNTAAAPWAALALPPAVVWPLCVLAMALAAASYWMAVAAIRTLGKQWSLQARLIEGHRLVVEGPYSHVRHPIYTAMLGMLIAAGISFSVWWALAAGVAIYSVGTAIRVRAEERLLQEAFGEDFEAYRRYVPAVIPRWKTTEN